MRKIRQEVADSIPNAGGVMEMMDMFFLPLFNVTCSEFDDLAEKCTDEEMQAVMALDTFSERRKALEIRNKYVPYYGGK